jgi:hypothetical protein
VWQSAVSQSAGIVLAPEYRRLLQSAAMATDLLRTVLHLCASAKFLSVARKDLVLQTQMVRRTDRNRVLSGLTRV